MVVLVALALLVTSEKNHFLKILIILEGISLLNFTIIFFRALTELPVITFVFVALVLIVAEAALGLSLLVMFGRQAGSETMS